MTDTIVHRNCLNDHVVVNIIIIIINYSIYKAHFTEKEKHSKAPVKFCQDVGKQARISVF